MHILQGDLILHKRTLEPIKTVLYGLRRYDVDRVAALMESLDPSVKVQGYMSHKAKIYLVCVLITIMFHPAHGSCRRPMSTIIWSIFLQA